MAIKYYSGINIAGNIAPSADSTYNIGAPALRFINVYGDNIYTDSINVSGTTTIDSSRNIFAVGGTFTSTVSINNTITTPTNTSLNIDPNGTGSINLRKNTSVTGTVTTSGNLKGSEASSKIYDYIADGGYEDKAFYNPDTFNAYAGAKQWANSITISNAYSSNRTTALSEIGGSVFNYGGNTWQPYFNVAEDEMVIEIDHTSEPLRYHAIVGIQWTSTSWRTQRVKIEAYNGTSWTTGVNVTDNAATTISAKFSLGSAGIKKLKITLGDPVSSNGYTRISKIFGYDYQGVSSYDPKASGTYYIEKYRDNSHYSNIYPETDSTYSLGTTSKKYLNIHADTFRGDLIGDVTGNISGNADTVDLLHADDFTLQRVTGWGNTTTNDIASDRFKSNSHPTDSFLYFNDDNNVLSGLNNVTVLQSISGMAFICDSNANGTGNEYFAFFNQDNTNELLRIKSGGNIDIPSGDLQIGGTTVIGSNRNVFPNKLSIGTTTTNALLHVKSNLTDNLQQVLIESTDVGSVTGPDITLYRNSESPAATDYLGALWFYGNNGADEQIQYSGIAGRIVDATDGTEDGSILFFNIVNGSLQNIVTISGDDMTVVGDVTANHYFADTHFRSTDTAATLSTTGAGIVYLRPNGYNQTTGQAYLTSGGVFNVTDRVVTGGPGLITSGNGSKYIQLGDGRTDNNYAYIDLIGDQTYTDYGLRIIRTNGGANTSSQILHRGTGGLQITTQEEAPILLKTTGSTRLYISSGGNVGINETSPSAKLHVAGDVILSNKRIVNLPTFNMGSSSVTDEYLVICKQAPTGSGVAASGIQGRIVFSRGSSGSYNNSHYIDINIQMSLDSGNVNNVDVNQFEVVTDQTTNHAFTQIEEIDISGTKYLALKARTTGGGASNHFYFEGSISDDGADTNILSRVRASDSNVTVTSPQPSGYPITPYIVKNNNGNIGIGVSPTYTLDVNSGGSDTIARFTSTDQKARILIEDDTDISYFGTYVGTTFIGSDDTPSGNTLNVDSSGNVGVGITSTDRKLDVGGSIRAGGKTTYTKSFSSLSTTGSLVAGLKTASNGASALFTFTCYGHSGGYQKIVISCYNSSGNWYPSIVIDEGTNDFEITHSSSGSSTISFTFKAKGSGTTTKSYTPTVLIEHIGSELDTNFL